MYFLTVVDDDSAVKHASVIGVTAVLQHPDENITTSRSSTAIQVPSPSVVQTVEPVISRNISSSSSNDNLAQSSSVIGASSISHDLPLSTDVDRLTSTLPSTSCPSDISRSPADGPVQPLLKSFKKTKDGNRM